MRVSKEQAEATRDRIIDVAAQLFRERGFDGIGVAELMSQAGLTHGGFYGHFKSKEDLMVEACQRAQASKLRRWKKMAATEPTSEVLRAIISDYLRPAHRDTPGNGCLLAALAAEAARQGPRVKGAVSQAIEEQLEVLRDLVPGDNKRERGEKALAIYSGMIGALLMSRAVSDPKLSADFLRAMEKTLTRIGA